MGSSSPIGSFLVIAGISGCFCARRPDARQPGFPLPVMFQPVCHPLQAAVRFLHPPIPHTHQLTLRFACLTDVAGQASGRDCHVPRIASIPRLGFVFPPAVVLVPQRIIPLRCPTTCRFWLRPIIAVGLSVVTKVQATIHMR